MLFIMTSSNWDVFHITGPFVRGIHQLQVNSPHKGQWQRALVLSLICAWINCWVNNLEAGDLRRHCAHYDVTVIYHAYLVFDLFGRVCEEHWGGGVTATHLGLCSLEGGDEGRVEKGGFWEAETRSHISGHTKIGVLEFKAQKMSYERPVKFMGGLVQICSNSIASAQWSYSSLALSHRFYTFKASKEAVVLENTDLCMNSGTFLTDTKQGNMFTLTSMVSCQKGPSRHAYAWQIGPFWQDTLDMNHCILAGCMNSMEFVMLH